jgi:tyrosyl-tRNA synthetase
MIGDPSGKSDERNLLDEATLNHNVEGESFYLVLILTTQIICCGFGCILRLDEELSFINFARDVGKRTVNYMMAKIL